MEKVKRIYSKDFELIREGADKLSHLEKGSNIQEETYYKIMFDYIDKEKKELDLEKAKDFTLVFRDSRNQSKSVRKYAHFIDTVETENVYKLDKMTDCFYVFKRRKDCENMLRIGKQKVLAVIKD